LRNTTRFRAVTDDAVAFTSSSTRTAAQGTGAIAADP
jgi:hypothetical protein